MEHLPPALDPYSPICVPYIGESKYDNLDFAGYPHRLKIDIDLLAGFPGLFIPETWLFFGRMCEILSMDIQMKELIRTDESGHIWTNTYDHSLVLDTKSVIPDLP
jgi:hypothetical protein